VNALLAILGFLSLGGVSPAENVVVTGLQGLGGTRYHRIESTVLPHGFDLLIGLPDGYASAADRDYPTIYILDGGELYPMLRAYYNYLRHSNEVPEAILVGISYGTREFELGNTRGHDFTAPSAEREYYGGAGDFQAFLSRELLPFVEREYRSDAERRVVFGQSLGGQFVLYSAQTLPSLFWGSIASNPALHRNLEFFLESRPSPLIAGARPRLFVGSGSDDEVEFRVPALRWIERWADAADAPWDLRAVTLEGHTHFSAPPAAFRQGMRWLFATSVDSQEQSSP
jgi:predicted alpha/beta superfamily hydrolase